MFILQDRISTQVEVVEFTMKGEDQAESWRNKYKPFAYLSTIY